MKILIIIKNLEGGGIERALSTLSNEWVRMGNTVEFVTFESGGVFEKRLDSGISVVVCTYRRLLRRIIFLFEFFKLKDPDIIICPMWPVTVIAVCAAACSGLLERLVLLEQANLPYGIYNYDAVHVAKKYSKIIPIPIGIVRSILLGSLSSSFKLFYSRSAMIFCSSEGVAESIKSCAPSIDKSKIIVIPNPADSSVEIRRLPAQPMMVPNARPVLLNVGRLAEAKDHRSLIEAVDVLIKAGLELDLIIVGEGHLRSSLEAQIRDSNLQDYVRLVGFRDNVDDYYRIADVFVLSSVVEGFANVLVEALSHGLSIVSTDCPSGPREVLADGRFGRLVPPGNPLLLANAISEALKNPTNRELLMARANDFNASKIAKQYLQVFRGLVVNRVSVN